MEGDESTWECQGCGADNPAGSRFCGQCGTRRAQEAEAAPAPDERRLVTALFADISGFTSLAERLDEEALHGIISPLITCLAGVAERYGGFVAKYAGDALLVFFGAPVAQEDHATRALLVAVEMHRELAAIRPDLAAEARDLELHIGVNTGRVISGLFGGESQADYSILGDAVNLAQRLESVAPSGETYVGETTYRLTRSRFDLEFVGALQVKGKQLPVPAWRVLGERADVLSAASASPEQSTTQLIDRVEELAAIEDALARTRRHEGGVVCLTGEPGVGKSRLTEETARLARETGMAWLQARCLSYGAGLAYWPFIDLMRRAFDIRIEQDPAAAGRRLADGLGDLGLADRAPYFARLLGVGLPSGSADVDSLEPEAFRRRLHEAFRSWLDALAAQQPVVLAVEDVHWIDGTSLELLRELTAGAADGPIAFHLSARPEGLATLESVAATVPAARRVEIQLEQLDAAATATFVESLLGGTPSAALLEMVAARTAGNPFYVQELIRSLRDGDLVHFDGETWELAPGWDAEKVPPTIEGVISARIDLLPRTAANVLQMASVVGRRVIVPLLEAIAEDVPDLQVNLDLLVTSGFLDRVRIGDEDVLAFHHALVVDVAYARLVKRTRRQLHRRAGEAAEALYGVGDDVIDILARHFYLAEAGAKAVDYLERAGLRAARLFANEEAILDLTRAVEVARENERLASRLPGLLLNLGDLHDLRGQYQEAFDHYREVRDATSDVRAWRGMAASLRKQGRFDDALALIDEAFRADEASDADLTPLWSERVWTLHTESRYADAVEAAHTGLVTADPHTTATGQLLLGLARAESQIGLFHEALTHAREAVELFETVGDLRWLTVAIRVMGGVQSDHGLPDEAAETFHRGLALAERVGNVEELAACLVNLGLAELRRGNVEEAIDCDRRALPVMERIGHQASLATTHVNLAEKLMYHGSLHEALAHCETGLDLARNIGMTWTIADGYRTLSGIRLRQGDAGEAVEHAEAAAALFAEIGDAANSSASLALAHEARELVGDAERARA